MIEFISCTDGPQATAWACGQCYVYIYKLLQLINSIKVSGGGLVVTL